MARRFRLDITKSSQLTIGGALAIIAGIILLVSGLLVGIAQSWEFLLWTMAKIGLITPGGPHRGLAFGVAVTLLIFTFAFLNNQPEGKVFEWHAFSRTVLFFGLTVVGIVSLFAWYVAPFLTYGIAVVEEGVVRFRAEIPYAIAISLVSFLLAFAAFKLRRARRKLYGHAEVLFGAFAILFAVYDVGNETTKLGVQFFGGLYIIVRGLSNIEDGLAGKHLSLAGYLRSFRDDVVFPLIYEETP
ncbi:hypothetical protein SAMN05216338_106020 [Bradyrhizobium sp. Rc2d]|uniref:hypothetical protein n=1 Tax=Bradyrhizobium sp. Rc2d TaxID=1855321 RepID=UPI000890E4F9|nr:hypothetical protein [Bradyrhizobium sp. Rc2d]SDJ68648.1 hypothetical protein SAMN05216338_106020 [Bradyrhizobium sp. Rc2d]